MHLFKNATKTRRALCSLRVSQTLMDLFKFPTSSTQLLQVFFSFSSFSTQLLPTTSLLLNAGLLVCVAASVQQES